jgi:hypothetical protein
MTALRIRELQASDYAGFQQSISALEHGVTYPLGDDRFAIDHGRDYFAFFRRLGDLSFFIALDGQRVAAVCAAVLRRIPPCAGAPPEPCWYVCDLKVHPDYRRRHIPWQMFCHGFPRKYPRCPRGYAISMNPGDGRPNPVVRLANHFHLAPVSVGTLLAIYSLAAVQMRAIEDRLRRVRGPLAYLSLAGIKDIVLSSSGEPMPLLHLHHGATASSAGALQPSAMDGHVHMFCLPANDPLQSELVNVGVHPSASASVIQHRMGRWDWRSVLTSEI